MFAQRGPPILTLMIASILLVGAVALWDERRESAAALGDFAAEQSTLARAAGSALAAHLATMPVGSSTDVRNLAATSIEEPGAVLALFQHPGEVSLVTRSGETRRCGTLERAIASRARWVILSRNEAASLGLPPRMAIAGLAEVAAGQAGTWNIAIVATALRVRDRERRAIWRLVLGFALTSALIGGFGGLARRQQKKELALARSLAIAEAAQDRDERLVRSDKLATLGALATGIAHEVSTPLGVIVGRAEQLATRVAADERGSRSVTVIIEQAERINQIVRAFLRLARGGAPSFDRVQPAEMALEALDLVEYRFAKAEVTLTSQLATELPRVACDRRLFEQVLVNLLLNACDACRANGRVELSVQRHGDRVVFKVVDDGDGITPEIAKRAIEPFFTTKPEASGTGLGLAISNEIVKHHHGNLTLVARADAPGTLASVDLAAAQEDHRG